MLIVTRYRYCKKSVTGYISVLVTVTLLRFLLGNCENEIVTVYFETLLQKYKLKLVARSAHATATPVFEDTRQAGTST